MYDRARDGKQFLDNLNMIKDQTVRKYLENRKIVRDRFQGEKTGEIQLFKDQSKNLEPIIKSQEETSKVSQEELKAIKDEVKANKDITSQALEPFTRELKRRNDQLDMLASQPSYNQAQIGEVPQQPDPIAQSTPVKKDTMVVDLDKSLNTTDRENLEEMEYELPSAVFATDTYDSVIERIKTENRSVGQYLGKGSAGKKIDDRVRTVFE